MAAAGIGAAATATGVLVKSAVDGYAEYEQLVGGVDTLFKENSKTVQQYADEAYKTAGLSANEYMSSVTGFSASLLQSLDGDTAKAADKANQAIIDMSDNANKMGTDMQMIQNAYQGFAKQNYTMLDNLKLGYGGTKTEMERLLEDATAISGIQYDVSNYADVVDAIHIVQTEMGITGTTAKEASTTIEGSVNSAKAAWQNLVVGIADDNQDFSTLVDNFVDSVGTAAENILPRIETAIGGVGKLIEKLLPVIVDSIPGVIDRVLPGLLDSGKNMVETLINGMSENMPAITESVSKIIGQVADSIIYMLPDLLWIGIDIVKGIIDGFISALPEMGESINRAFVQLCEGFGDISYIFAELATNLMQALAEGIANGSDLTYAFSNLLTWPLSAIKEYLPSFMQAGTEIISSIISGLTELLPDIIQEGVSVISNFATGLAQALPELIPQAVSMIITLVESLIDNIPMLIDAALQLVIGLATGIIDALPIIIEKLPEIITSIIDALLNAIPQIIDAGIQLFVAVVRNTPAIIMGIIEAIPQIIGGIIKSLLSFQKDMAQAGFDLLIKIIKNLPQLVEDIKEKIKNLPEAIIKTIEWGLKNIPEIGKNIVNGLWNGISSSWDWLIDNVKNVASSLIDSAKEIFGIHSPSTKFRYMGEMCVAGFDEGIDDLFDADTLNKSINASFGTLSANVKYASEDSTSGGINTDDIRSAVAAGAREGIEGANINTYLDNRKVTQSVDKELSNTETTKGRYGT